MKRNFVEVVSLVMVKFSKKAIELIKRVLTFIVMILFWPVAVYVIGLFISGIISMFVKDDKEYMAREKKRLRKEMIYDFITWPIGLVKLIGEYMKDYMRTKN